MFDVTLEFLNSFRVWVIEEEEEISLFPLYQVSVVNRPTVEQVSFTVSFSSAMRLFGIISGFGVFSAAVKERK